MAGQKIRIRLKAMTTRSSTPRPARSWKQSPALARRSSARCRCRRRRTSSCVIRSPHKYKDSREHFEMRTHKRLIDIVDPTPKAVDSLMRLDLPADVNIEIKL